MMLWRSACRRASFVRRPSVADPLAIAWLALIVVAEGLVAAARHAMMNTHPPALQKLQEEGVMGAALAARIASEASRLLFATSVAQTGLRLLALGFAWAALGLLPLLPAARVAAALAGGAIVLGVVELAAHRIVLRASDRWATRLSPVAAILVWSLSPLQKALAGLMEPSGSRGA